MREMLSSASSFFHFWEELGPRNPSGNNLVLSYQWRTGLTPKLPPKGWKKLLSNSQPLIFPCHPKSMISFIVCRSLKPPTTTLTHLHRPRLVLRLRHRLRSTLYFYIFFIIISNTRRLQPTHVIPSLFYE